MDESFSLLAQMMAIVDGPVAPKVLEKIVSRVIEGGFGRRFSATPAPPSTPLSETQFKTTANAVFSKSVSVDLEGTARALTGAATSHKGQPNDALMIGIAQAAKSQRGRNLIIEEIKTGLASKLSEVRRGDIARNPLEPRAELEYVRFILQVGHELSVNHEDLGLPTAQVQTYLQSLLSNLSNLSKYRAFSEHEDHAERLRSVFVLLPDAIVASALGDLSGQIERNIGPADPYLIHLSPFVRMAKPSIKQRMKDAAIRLVGARVTGVGRPGTLTQHVKHSAT